MIVSPRVQLIEMPPFELYPPALAITSCFCPLRDKAYNAAEKTRMYLFIQGCFL
jgi:hypothetical protein